MTPDKRGPAPSRRPAAHSSTSTTLELTRTSALEAASRARSLAFYLSLIDSGEHPATPDFIHSLRRLADSTARWAARAYEYGEAA